MLSLEKYTYVLPEACIADRPPKVRGSSRLLVLNRASGSLQDMQYTNLPDFMRPDYVLVINDTKVIPARLQVTTENGTSRELLLLEKHGTKSEPHAVYAMYRGKLRPNQLLHIGSHTIIVDEILSDGVARISSNTSFAVLTESFGTVPLPPYMHRDADEADRKRYQTEFAAHDGSVAAPTASLNLTYSILRSIESIGATVTPLTLHVGIGTFMPIRTDDISKHVMHKEYYFIPTTTVETIKAAKKRGSRVIAIGTTVTRTLEHAAEQIMSDENRGPISGEADIFIFPGYEFRIVDTLVTNFHAPKTTVLMMAAAFAGWPNLQHAYQHAVKSGYKFLSYGDSMLII